MRRRLAITLVSLIGSCGDNETWRPLFDGNDLDGWYSWLPSQGQNSDPHGIFRVEDGMIHILAVDLAPADFEFGYLATTSEYENFRIRFEYKWGTRKYVSFPRDSGVFVTMVGPDVIWPRSEECQVMENDTGSVYLFELATLETTIDPALADPTYLEGGQPFSSPRVADPFPRITHSGTYDRLTDWNQVEIDVFGEDTEHIVNGHTTFRSTHRRQPDPEFPDDPTKDIPLTKGRIVLQEERAELMYRNIEILEL